MRQNPHVRICGGPGSATTLVYPTLDFPNAANRRRDLRQQRCIIWNSTNALRPLRRRLYIRSIRQQTITNGEQNDREHPYSDCDSTIGNPRPMRLNEADDRP